ncbi:glutamine--fructose-6-phosphate transaminase (isomerizing) [Helicobacter suis]|uniref:glutamine--fructose-6-phosphate transaminase (isomerizing) n=1 Tax=Helicobacter suis TaxID=104628 RepID=UPI0015967A6B|nr:glutamine--fructose-6-phosphate transaminase (isomerizing) [Helicobacter suis]BCD49937.1 Glucosamine--fructose-6-phosphate aminotransferase GlmS [Helicobacter suis]
MCGIIGYIGVADKKTLLLEGLKELDYRGYDSAGLATIRVADSKLEVFKTSGKITALEALTQNFSASGLGVGIAHTRWATHGKPTTANAHPHVYQNSALVHNGIIENYAMLKADLKTKGHVFSSQTDSEVVVHIFEEELANLSNSNSISQDLALQAFKNTIAKLEGAYAILLIHAKLPTCIFYAKNRSPLLLAKTQDSVYFASAESGLIGRAEQMVRLEEGALGCMDYNTPLHFKTTPISKDIQESNKEGFATFMEKEIYEQDKILTLLDRWTPTHAHLELPKGFLDQISTVTISACGSSYHAALVAKYLIESLAHVKVQVELASEYRYGHFATRQDELFIAISQSGESADTLEALKLAKNLGLKTLGVCNTQNSTMGALADATLLTRAGLEKSVASTKAFSSQVLLLWLLALVLAKQNKLDTKVLHSEMQALKTSMQAITDTLKLHEKVKEISKHILDQNPQGYFFMGRGVFYPLALEGALKLKEIAYVYAQGYASAEMKHGPIALADCNLLCTALLPANLLFAKNCSSVEELQARDARIFALSPENITNAHFQINTPHYPHYMPEFFSMLVVLQLFALEMAQLKGLNVDKPRNLAKSVTVE